MIENQKHTILPLSSDEGGFLIDKNNQQYLQMRGWSFLQRTHGTQEAAKIQDERQAASTRTSIALC